MKIKILILPLLVLLLTAGSCTPQTTKRLGEAGAECVLSIALKGVSVDTALSCLKSAGVKLNDKEVFAEIKQQLLKRVNNAFLKALLDIIVPPEVANAPQEFSLQSIDTDFKLTLKGRDEMAGDILSALAKLE